MTLDEMDKALAACEAARKDEPKTANRLRVFMLEDDPDRIIYMCRFLDPLNVDWTCVQTCHRVYEFKPPYDFIFLDHDLGGRQMDNRAEDSGYTFLRHVVNTQGINEEAVVILHSYNPVGAKRMQQVYPRAMIAPFGGDVFKGALAALDLEAGRKG